MIRKLLAEEVALRIKAEDRARQSERLLERASRVGHLGAWSIDQDWHVGWTAETLAILGFPEQDQPRLADGLALLDPARRTELESALTACMLDGTPIDVECRARTVDGRWVWLRIIGEAERDVTGRIHRTVGALQDITAKKNAEQALQELNDRLTTTLESITDAFFTVDRDWRFTYVNGEAERLLGHSRCELIGEVVWEKFPKSADTPFHRNYERALAESVTVKFEEWSDELSRWFQVAAYPSAQGLAVYFRDVTDSHVTRQALMESERRYRMLFQTCVDAIFLASTDGSVAAANPAACAMFRCSEEDLRRRGRAGVIAPDEARLQPLLDERELKGKAAGEMTMVRGDGTRFEAEVTSAWYEHQGRIHSHVFVRDITQRLEYEKEILKLNNDLGERVRQRTAELEAANADLRSFAHSLAHDLRTPIAAIDGFGAELERSVITAGSSADRHHIRRIRAAARRMHEFVDSLLTLAQVSQVCLISEDVDLSAMAHSILAELRDRDHARLVETHVEPGMCIRGDPRLLRMALENLLGNAWKFTSRRPAARISFASSGSSATEAVYCVRDNGAGFDAKYADKLFNIFQRLHTEAEFPGTGVGLVNVARIVVRHGGRVWAEGAEGLGASFFFCLPRGGA
jgi:PAS domain S-box-containing protein